MLYFEKFIKEHDNWEELLTTEPYNLKISRDDGYILFKYNQLSSDFSIPEVKEARGIIFRESDMKCVCHPFDKFMNAEEPQSDLNKIDWSTASVQEKLDGSLMKIWYDNGWHLSTNGTINAFKAPIESTINYKSFGDLFVAALPLDYEVFTEILCKDYCYMFELVSPDNRVVIKYPKPKVYLLGVRDMTTHQEYNPEGFNFLRNHLDIPKRYSLSSYEEVCAAAELLNEDISNITDEGFVVCCTKYTENGSFLRVKIKSFKYVSVSRLGNNGVITWERLLNVILDNEVNEFLAYLPDYKERIDLLKSHMQLFRNDIETIVAKLDPESFANRKEYAEKVKEFPAHKQQFLFKYDRLADTFDNLTAAKWKQILQTEGVI